MDITYGSGEPHHTFATRKPCPLTVNGLPCELGKGHKRPCSVSTAAVMAHVADRMDRLRETAAELRAGKLHPAHAANRIEKIANEINRTQGRHHELRR